MATTIDHKIYEAGESPAGRPSMDHFHQLGDTWTDPDTHEVWKLGNYHGRQMPILQNALGSAKEDAAWSGLSDYMNRCPDGVSKSEWIMKPEGQELTSKFSTYDEAHAAAKSFGVEKYAYKPNGQSLPDNPEGIYGTGNGDSTPNPPTPPEPPTPPTPSDPPVDPVDPPTPPAGGDDWWRFFISKEFLIGAAIFGGIIAAIKALGNTIKARFRKCAKVLYTMQKDFGGSENGMDMDHALPGVGSKITDVLVKMFGRGKKTKGALGLRPFVQNYRDELAADYHEARKAFNMIAAAGKGIEKPEEDTTGQTKNNVEVKNSDAKKESVQTIYSSFSEAMKAETLNETEAINEVGVVAVASGIVSLASVAFRAGNFVFSKKDKNGKDVGEGKVVQVTKQSTREICYSILNMFFNKYFNMEKVSEKMGIPVDSLGDIDASNIDKFIKIANQMKSEQAEGKVSNMYARVKKNYFNMVGSYCRIADGVVYNFEKHTKKAMTDDNTGHGIKGSEKNEDLLVAAKEKLRAEVARQKDLYENNFYRVMNAIITSPEYLTYIDFIVKDVLPVFKSGLASDADYVLDVVPREGDVFVIRQTNEQYELNPGETAVGNVALAKVVKFTSKDKKNPEIAFTLVGLLKDPGSLKKTDKNEYDFAGYDKSNIDKTAYSGKAGEENNSENIKTLPYDKWLALDPIIAINFDSIIKPEDLVPRSKLYTREYNGKTEYVYALVDPSEYEKLNKGSNASEAFVEDAPLQEDGEAKANIVKEEPARDEVIKKEILPGDKASQEYHVNKIYACSVANGTSLDADIKTNQFSGSSLLLAKKCNFKEFDTYMTSQGFKGEEGHWEEKKAIELNTNKQQGYTHTNGEPLETIEPLSDRVHAISDRKTEAEGLHNISDSIAKSIVEACAKNGVADYKNFFGSMYYGRWIYVWNPKIKHNELVCPHAIVESLMEDEAAPARSSQPQPQQAQAEQPAQSQEPQQQAQQPQPQQQTVPQDPGVETYKINEGNGWFSLNTGLKKKDSNGVEGEEIFIVVRPFIYDKTNNQEIVLKTNGKAPVNYTAEELQNAAIGIILQPSTHFDVKTLADSTKNVACASIKNPDTVKESVDKFIDALAKAGEIEAVRGETTEQKEKHTGEVTNKSQQAQAPAQESVEITYDKFFNLAESFMGSFIPGGNLLEVHRHINTNMKNVFVLSENAWGDGSVLKPVEHLERSMDNILKRNTAYDDFALLAKSSHTVNFMPVAENCSYKTSLPYNRFQMLTEANPLYESTVILGFNEEGQVTYINKLGINKIIG